MNMYNENQNQNFVGVGNDSSGNNSRVKSKLIAIVIIILVFLIGIFLLYKFFIGNSSENNSIPNIFDNKSSFKYDIKLNGKNYILPMKLLDFVGKKYYYRSDSLFSDKVFNQYDKEKFWQIISLSPPEVSWYSDDYVSIPDAGYESFITNLSVMLVHKADTDLTSEKNYTLVGFSAINVAKDFFTLNNVGCGDSIQDFIDNLNIDINSVYATMSKDKDGNISYLKYWDEKNNIVFEIFAAIIGEKKGVYNFKIYLYDTEKYS